MSSFPIIISDDPDENWSNNSIQFPRLIAEMEACGFFSQQHELLSFLCHSMDLDLVQIQEIIDRAQQQWEAIKQHTP